MRLLCRGGCLGLQLDGGRGLTLRRCGGLRQRSETHANRKTRQTSKQLVQHYWMPSELAGNLDSTRLLPLITSTATGAAGLGGVIITGGDNLTRVPTVRGL